MATLAASRHRWIEQQAVSIGFIALATLALLMPAQNDTWWHLRSGREMVASHHWLFEDTFSTTAYGRFFWNHSWLSQIVFYVVFAVGGLPLLTAVCAGIVVGAWTIAWRLMNGGALDKLLLLGASVAAGTVTWSLRPQVFSLLFVALTLLLIVRDRWRWLPLMFAVWANLHAGFALGVLLVGAAVLDAAIEDRAHLVARLGWFATSVAATLLTPLGARNWIEIAASMGRSHANAIQEWRPTALPPENLLFWALVAWLAGLTVMRWRRLAAPADRLTVAVSLLAAVMAARSFRNVATAMILVAIAISRLVWSSPESPARLPQRRRDVGLVTVAALMSGLLVVAAAWTAPWPRLGWRPMNDLAANAIARCAGPLYNSYADGGPIIWFAPAQRVFLDSRQDPYPDGLVREATEVDQTGNFEGLFKAFGIGCAAVRPGSPVAVGLKRAGWGQTYADARWEVFVRSSSSAK